MIALEIANNIEQLIFLVIVCSYFITWKLTIPESMIYYTFYISFYHYYQKLRSFEWKLSNL